MKDLIIVRGGGDLATGTIYKLKKSGFPVLILEVSDMFFSRSHSHSFYKCRNGFIISYQSISV